MFGIMDLLQIETSRLILKKLVPQDFVYIFTHCDEAAIRRLLGHETDEEFVREREKFESGYTSFRSSFVFFQLIEKSSMRIIGGAGFHNWYAEHRRAELGYMLKHDTDKQAGYMSEALAVIVPYGYNEMELNRIEAYVSPMNVPSLRIMEKFGFTREGLLREHYKTAEKIDDSVVFSLLRGEYKGGVS